MAEVNPGMSDGEFGNQTHRIGKAAKERVSSTVEAQKGVITAQLGEVASALEETARTLEEKGVPGGHKYASMAADRVRSISDSIEGRSVDEILQQVKVQFRESPLPMLLGCVALGFIGARLMRS